MNDEMDFMQEIPEPEVPEIEIPEIKRDFGEIVRRRDGSYEITENGMPYHVPVGHPLFADVDEYALEHPDRVTLEPEPEPPTLEEVKAAKKAEIAAARWAAEVGGVTIQGMTIDTSRESQGLVTGAALQAVVDSSYVCRWKTSAGFVELSAEMIMAVAGAVRQHVQACFDREAVLVAQVDAAGTAAAVEAVSW